MKKSFKFTFVLLSAGMMAFTLMCGISLGSTDTGEVTVRSQNLNVYGFLRNNYGYFLQDQDYTLNNDKLATNRTWLRTNVDYHPSDAFSMFASLQLVYEPEYEIEKGSVSKPDGKEYSEYKKTEDIIREAYIDWRPNKNNSFRIGRQIVIWGESLTTQVGDVVNPLDNRFTFAFANWEDTRIPLWMVKGLHEFDGIASSFEWLVSPNLVDDEYRVNRDAEYANPSAGIFASQRFAVHPEDRFLPPYAVGNDFYASIDVLPAGAIAANPVSRGWSYNPYFPGNGWMSNEIPNVTTQYPSDNLRDTRFGFRTSTFLGGYEFGVSYYHTQIYEPVLKRGALHESPLPGIVPPTRDYTLVYPDVDYIGAYMNKDTAMGVIRAEAIYAPNKSFGTFDPADFDAVTQRDYYKYMVAWDLTGFLYFDWHKSAPFDITIEHTAEYIPDNKNIQNVIYGTQVEQYKPYISGRITTNWFYNLIQTDLIFSYGFKGKDGLIMPLVKWMPAWKDRAFSAELRYIGIFGDNDYEDLGMFRQKDMIVLTTQFNF